MGKKALNTNTMDKTAKRSKSRPLKSLVRQHRQEQLAQTDNPQAESPQLTPDQDKTLDPTQNKANQRASRLPSSLHWPKRGHTEINNQESPGALHDGQSPTATARRSSVLSWGSRHSATSVVDETSPGSRSFICQPSVRLIGSLNGAINEMHLPLVSKKTKARLNVLKLLPKQQLEVTINRSDELPFGAYSHPQVRVHVVDRCTGRALCPAQMTEESTFGLASNDTNVFEWQQTLNVSVDMLSFLNPRAALLFEILERKSPSKGSRFRRGNRFESVSTRDPDESGAGKQPDSSLQVDYRRIAWGFFHAITNKGNPTMPSFVLPHVTDGEETLKATVSDDMCELRVRLFQYQVLTWMDHYQAKVQWGWRKNHPTVPAVFLQYQKRSRAPAPSTLHVQLRAIKSVGSPRQPGAPRKNECSAELPENNNNEIVDSTSGGDNQEPPSEVSPPASPGKAEIVPLSSTNESIDMLAPCKRNPTEPCLIPQRVLCSLPTGKKGCSALSFSPCGRYLAASVSPEQGEFNVQVYDMAFAELCAVGRGHRGVIYSLQWNAHPARSLRLLSASSDGTARLWELPAEVGDKSTAKFGRLLPLVYQWQHFPSFVYCAVFLPDSNGGVVLTGASDGCLRFRKEATVLNSEPEFGMLKVSSVAVHSICSERKGGRIFCGDANGDITVWRRPSHSQKDSIADYELVKTIRTGQTSITSLQLHPRKAHLLVHTQPNAIFQYELRSYLLLNKSYAGISCEKLLVKSSFSPDGKLVISGSEDGVPRLFTSLHGNKLQRSVWGTRFFHDCPVLDVSWSPAAHITALCSYGGSHPIVVLCAYRDDKDAVFVDEAATNSNTLQLVVEAFRGNNQNDADSNEHAQRLQRALERRRQRLQAKVSVEAEISNNSTASTAV